jgi:hypothetical protein
MWGEAAERQAVLTKIRCESLLLNSHLPKKKKKESNDKHLLKTYV